MAPSTTLFFVVAFTALLAWRVESTPGPEDPVYLGPLELQWTRLPANGPTPSARHTYATVTYKGTVYYVGGSSGKFGDLDDLSDMWTYNPEDNTFTEEFSMGNVKPSPRLGTVGAGLAAHNSTLYMFGGADADVTFGDSLWLYDLRDAEWFEIERADDDDSYPDRRRDFCFFTRGDKLIALGGISPRFYLTDVWSFDINTYKWTQLSQGNTNNGGFWNGGRGFACEYDSIDDVVYTFGGEGAEDDFYTNNVLSRFNFSDNTWYVLETTGTKPPIGADMASYYDAPSKTLIIAWGNDKYFSRLNANAYMINVGNLQWQVVDTGELKPRHRMKMAPIGDDKAIIFGGVSEETVLSQVVLFDFPSKTFSELKPNRIFPSPRRGAASASIASEIYIFGGTDNNNNIVRDMFRTDDTGVWFKVIPVGTGPEARQNAALTSNGLILYMFGGLGEFGDFKSDLWSFNTKSLVWENLTPRTIAGGGEVPLGRYSHTITAIDRQFYMFGGITQAGSSNELWVLDPGSLTWRFIQNQVNVVGNYSLWQNTLAAYSDTSKQPLARSSHAACIYTREDIDPESPHRLVIFGGELETELNDVWFFDPYRQIWSPRPTDLTNIEPRHESSVIANGDLIIVYGGNTDRILHQDLVYAPVPFLDSDVEDDFVMNFTDVRLPDSPTLLEPPFLAGHTVTQQKDTMLVFGGYTSLPDEVSQQHDGNRAFTQNTLWKLKMGPICDILGGFQVVNSSCLLCSAGSYAQRVGASTECVLCPNGRYSEFGGGTQCDPCPAGFYNVLFGSQSRLQCASCEEQSYQPNNGSSTCLPCPANRFCPVASIVPLLSKTSNDPLDPSNQVTHVQPPPYPRKTDEVKKTSDDLTLWGWTWVGSLFIVLVLLAVIPPCTRIFGPCLVKFDFLFKADHEPKNVKEKKEGAYKTPLGGAFTIATILSVAILVALVLLPIMDNINETRALIPNVALSADDTKLLRGNFSVQFAALQYGGFCIKPLTTDTCEQGISATVTGAQVQLNNGSQVPVTSVPGSTSLKCSRFGNVFTAADSAALYGTSASRVGACVVTWTCTNCRLTQNVGSFKFSLQEEFSYASSFRWNVTVTSGIDNEHDVPQPSSAIGRLNPTSPFNTFRGSSPSIVSMQFSQSRYDNLINLKKASGYVLQFLQETKGDEVNSVTFQDRQFVNFWIGFSLTDRTFEVVRSLIQDEFTFMASVFGTITGQLGLMAAILAVLEVGLLYYLSKYGREEEKRDLQVMEKLSAEEEAEMEARIERALRAVQHEEVKSGRSSSKLVNESESDMELTAKTAAPPASAPVPTIYEQSGPILEPPTEEADVHDNNTTQDDNTRRGSITDAAMGGAQNAPPLPPTNDDMI